MPICSFASATRRSAAAMSGRRSRSCDGTPTGITGGSRFSGDGGKAEFRRRLADQHRDGVLDTAPAHRDIGVLHAGGFELRLRLSDVGLRRSAPPSNDSR